MVNKKGVWFLTLFSLILVLSVYYITMPSELLMVSKEKKEDVAPTVNTEESTLLVALRVEDEEKVEKEMESLKKIISDSDSTIQDKNAAFEKMKELNNNRSMEEKLEEKIKTTHNLNTFVKIKEKNISVTINNAKHSVELANKIMRTIQEDYTEPMKITVTFKSE